MDDALSGDHPVHLAWPNEALGTRRVSMEDGAGEEIRERAKADVRVRSHVHGVLGGKGLRTEVVDEAERAHRSFLASWQQAADRERRRPFLLFGQELRLRLEMDALLRVSGDVFVLAARLGLREAGGDDVLLLERAMHWALVGNEHQSPLVLLCQRRAVQGDHALDFVNLLPGASLGSAIFHFAFLAVFLVHLAVRQFDVDGFQRNFAAICIHAQRDARARAQGA
mmetsp:Transcript_10624/g.40016  ORF Transcript_10624/g.40016 Transcript_10624/m.40016 type:complete len:225 (-) Transcript_10624:244-918(-)|eukprot:scaffold1355_cov268-Pinguiococcus_pyrenoidosus.AAC.27